MINEIGKSESIKSLITLVFLNWTPWQISCGDKSMVYSTGPGEQENKRSIGSVL